MPKLSKPHQGRLSRESAALFEQVLKQVGLVPAAGARLPMSLEGEQQAYGDSLTGVKKRLAMFLQIGHGVIGTVE